jgi:hypothetical protein
LDRLQVGYSQKMVSLLRWCKALIAAAPALFDASDGGGAGPGSGSSSPSSAAAELDAAPLGLRE